MILIATGTGIAPFLSVIKEKEVLNKLDNKTTVLLYGCRYENKDFIEITISPKIELISHISNSNISNNINPIYTILVSNCL